MDRDPHTGLHFDVLAKVAVIFGQNFAAVLKAHRRVETLTQESNLIGRQNLVEAFAHLSTIFANAHKHTRDQQLEQVAHLQDHLRRVMMESFETEVYVCVAAIWSDGGDRSVGRLYDAMAAPLIRRGRLHGHIEPEEVDRRLDQVGAQMVEARGAKVADGDFSEWESASRVMEEAARDLRLLKREVGAAVDAANAMRLNRRYWWTSIALSALAGAALSLIVAVAVG